MPMEKDTVSMHFVRSAVAALPPARRAALLRDSGIEPGALRGPAEARVSAASFSALWLAVARELDDEFFGLDRRRMKVGSFALLARSLLGTGTAGRALERLLRGMALFLDDVHGELQRSGGEWRLELHNRIADGAARRFADETFLVLAHGLLSWLVGRRIEPRRAAFAHPAPVHAAEYRLMFCDAVSFDAPQTLLVFDAACAAMPVVQREATLGPFLRAAPRSVFLKYRNREGWVARVRRRLAARAEGAPWPGLGQLAAEWGLAPATLRRHLQREGESYRSIKDRLRSEAALALLREPGLPLAEVAARLGFQEVSAFHRAFKAWTGLRPGEVGARAQVRARVRVRQRA